MGWQEINFERYAAEVKKNLKISLADEIVKLHEASPRGILRQNRTA